MPAIWNLVTEKDNPKKAGAVSQPQPSDPATQPVVVPPVDPPSKPDCVANPPTKPKDAHEERETGAAGFFCETYAKDTVQQAPDIHKTVTWTTEIVDITGNVEIIGKDYTGDGTTSEDDIYDMSVTAVKDCKPPGDGSFNLGEPVKGHKCLDIMKDAWKTCYYNQGRGGTITAGCLKYTVNTKF